MQTADGGHAELLNSFFLLRHCKYDHARTGNKNGMSVSHT